MEGNKRKRASIAVIIIMVCFFSAACAYCKETAIPTDKKNENHIKTEDKNRSENSVAETKENISFHPREEKAAVQNDIGNKIIKALEKTGFSPEVIQFSNRGLLTSVSIGEGIALIRAYSNEEWMKSDISKETGKEFDEFLPGVGAMYIDYYEYDENEDDNRILCRMYTDALTTVVFGNAGENGFFEKDTKKLLEAVFTEGDNDTNFNPEYFDTFYEKGNLLPSIIIKKIQEAGYEPLKTNVEWFLNKENFKTCISNDKDEGQGVYVQLYPDKDLARQQFEGIKSVLAELEKAEITEDNDSHFTSNDMSSGEVTGHEVLMYDNLVINTYAYGEYIKEWEKARTDILNFDFYSFKEEDL